MANKFIEKLVLGDTEKSLPKTRKKQFKLIILNNFFLLLKYNFFIFLFVLPIIVVKIIFSYTISSITDQSQILAYLYRESFISIFLIMLISIPVSGVSYIIRKKIWNDEILSENIFTGVKKEYKTFLVIFFIIGVSNFIFETGFYYYNNIYTANLIVKNILVSISIIQFILVSISSMYMITMTTRYNLKLKDLFLNSIKLSIKFLFKNIVIIVITLSPWMLIYFLSPAYQIIIVISTLLGYYSIAILIIFEYTANIFDKYVNKTKFIDIYRKGLAQD